MHNQEGVYYTNSESLPDLQTAFSQFEKMYPHYSSGAPSIESLRSQEYSHLIENGRVCLDYCGFGLFTYHQQMEEWESCSFNLATMEENFYSHMLHGAPKDGTLEYSFRSRIMKYLNIDDTEYSMVFTASRGAAFSLLANAYPFASYPRLIPMYDYESESVGWLVQRAKEKGAKVYDLSFKWPSLRVASTQLRKLLVAKRNMIRKASMKGLFVFPAQSRVSGSKYSYQWMSLAQQNKWHVLLDASSLGPKDMGSLGLSFFKPDFIIASFYKVFGADPSGFGCFFVKDTALLSIQDQSRCVAEGIVKIIPPPFELSSSGNSYRHDEIIDDNDDDGSVDEQDNGSPSIDFEFPKNPNLAPMVASFSGPVLGFDQICSTEGISFQTRVKKESHKQEVDDEEEDEDDDNSLVCDSNGEVWQSPVFSDEGAVNVGHIDNISSSPIQYTSHTSIASDDQLCIDPNRDNPLCAPSVERKNLPEANALRSPLFEDNSLANEPVKQEYTLSRSSNNVDSVLATSDRLLFSYKSSFKIGMLKDPDDGSLKANDSIRGIASHMEHEEEVNMINTNNKREVVETALVAISVSHEIEELNQDPAEEIKDAKGLEEKLQRSTSHGKERNGPSVGRSLSPFRENPEKTQHMGELHLDSQGGDDFEANRLDDDYDGNYDDTHEWEHHQVVCKGLDHADMLGLNKATLRLKCLINWLIESLLQLRHAHSHMSEKSQSLVHVYGPRAKHDRGASIAFNLYDSHGRLVHPELVQMLGDKNNISLSIGFLRNIRMPDKETMLKASVDEKKVLNGFEIGKMQTRVEVVTAALSFLSTFEDVYKLWVFASSFLDVHYVAKQLGGHKVSSLQDDPRSY